jgi:hypothetical protein
MTMGDTKHVDHAVGTELLFENDVVRVWDMALAPGEASPVHQHFHDYVIAYAEPLEAEIHGDGRVERRGYLQGFVSYRPVPVAGSDIQQLANRGDRFHRHFVVELLGRNEAAPRAGNGRERMASSA